MKLLFKYKLLTISKHTHNMKESTFILLCNSLFIHPDIALENEEIRQALRDRQTDEQIKQLLLNNF